MSRRNWLFALTATAALTPLALLAAPAAGPSAPPGAVERGRYLVMLAGCNRCHTPWEASGLGPQDPTAELLSNGEARVMPKPEV